GLKDPVWSVAEAKPGDTVDLTVTADKPLTADQYVELRIRDKKGMVAVIPKAAPGSGSQYKAQSVVPAFPGSVDLEFDAVLRESPTPANGQMTSRGQVRSKKLTVHGFKVTITSVDAAFVPKQENLHVEIHVDNDGGAPLKGRYEIWGERYPTTL